MNAYKELPYESLPIVATAPEHLCVRARLRGLTPPSLATARVMEIGCGDGNNLIALASYRPDMQFFGFDPRARAIEHGREQIAALGLRNLHLEATDLERLEPPDERFDFVIAHGIYSWVDEQPRRALRELAARALSPEGFLYVSYNTMPGWALRGAVREHLLRAGFDQPSREHAEAAVEHARKLLELLPEEAERHGHVATLYPELRRLMEHSLSYIAHEYLAPHNRAYWFSELQAEMAEVGLGYVADAYEGRPEGWVPKTLEDGLDNAQIAGATREDAIDLLRNRTMRASIFARAGRVPPEAPSQATNAETRLEATWLAGAFYAGSDSCTLDPGVEDTVKTGSGFEIRIAHPLLKASLWILGSRWPEGLAFSPLYAQSVELVRSAGFGTTLNEGDREALAQTFLQMNENAQLVLRGAQARLRVEPGRRPRALPLARLCAERGRAVAAPTHDVLWLDPLDRALLTRMDGTRDRDRLVGEIAERVDRGELELEGVPAGADAYRLRAVLGALVDQALMKLGMWGLIAS